MQVTQLSTLFRPDNYELSLMMNRLERTFTGTVTVHGTSMIDGQMRLHAKDLTITGVVVEGHNASFEFDETATDELIISCSNLKAGTKSIIVITFSGVITDGMHGLYPCYFEENGVKKELLATQFESHHAREVFPCIDEPGAKATYDVTLTTEQGVEVLSNMPVKLQSSVDDKLVTIFETSPRMSSYLLAWVVGELQKITGKTKRGVEVSIWSTPAQPIASLDFALDIATRTIDFYESYFDTEYPLPKSDHVALPDFTSGAMENWGLITYREIALLADPATTSISSKQYIATVIAHELAHQWFGNLVTMKWWNDLWLNESFATLMEYLAVDALEPTWNMWLEFSTNESILALRRDSIDGVQSVQIDVNHPDEITTLFDGAIVYAKGARLLRMLQQYVGDEDFQASLKTYFKTHAFQNTEAADLWKAIDNASGKDISGLMNTWLTQPGYPVIEATQKGDELSLSQSQFFVGPHEPSDRTWPIPLGADDDTLPVLFTEKSGTFTHTTKDLLLNKNDSAHFITHYDKELQERLIAQIKNGIKDDSIAPLNRLQFIHESILLARGELLPSVQLLDIIDAYRDETSEPVWSLLFAALAELRKFVEHDDTAEQKLRALSGEIALPLYKKLGWDSIEGESEEDTKLRATILSLTLYGENPEAIQTAKNIYADVKLEDIDAELRPLILSTVVRYGDAEIVNTLLSIHRSTHSSELEHDIASGLTSTRDPHSIAQLLAAIKNSDIVRPQDAVRWFAYLVRGRDSREQAWDWLQENWSWIETTFGGDKSYDYFPLYSASALTTREQLKAYEDFFGPKKSIVALTRVITMGISEIQGRVELIERDGPAVCDALKNN